MCTFYNRKPVSTKDKNCWKHTLTLKILSISYKLLQKNYQKEFQVNVFMANENIRKFTLKSKIEEHIFSLIAFNSISVTIYCWYARRDTPCPRPGRRPGGATPRPRGGGCAGVEGPKGATPRSRSGGVAMRRYPSPKVRSSGCALLEQPWRDNPRLKYKKPKWDGRCCKRASEGRHTETILREN